MLHDMLRTMHATYVYYQHTICEPSKSYKRQAKRKPVIACNIHTTCVLYPGTLVPTEVVTQQAISKVCGFCSLQRILVHNCFTSQTY